MLRYTLTRTGQGIRTAFVLLTAVFSLARISGNLINLVVCKTVCLVFAPDAGEVSSANCALNAAWEHGYRSGQPVWTGPFRTD